MGKKISTQEEAVAWAEDHPFSDVVFFTHGGQSVSNAKGYGYHEHLRKYAALVKGSIVPITEIDCVSQPPKTREMTDAEVFKALRDGAIIKSFCDTEMNYWASSCDMRKYKICYNYTGNDDVWKNMEVVDG